VAARGGDYPSYSVRGKQTRCAASEEDANHLSPLHVHRLRFQIALERLHVTALIELTVQRVGVEIAIRALPDAPGEVDVER
jgi:hypothetical protein